MNGEKPSYLQETSSRNVSCNECEKEIYEEWIIAYKKRNICLYCYLKQITSEFVFPFGTFLFFWIILGVIPTLITQDSLYIFGLSIYFAPRIVVVMVIYLIGRYKAQKKIQIIETLRIEGLYPSIR